LSLALVWVILGICLRTPGLSLRRVLLLALLFTAAYFTHLVGFLLGLTGALLAMLFSARRRAPSIAAVLVAALPAIGLTIHYWVQTGFGPSALPLRGSLVHDFFAIEEELFDHHLASEIPGWMIAAACLTALTLLNIRERP